MIKVLVSPKIVVWIVRRLLPSQAFKGRLRLIVLSCVFCAIVFLTRGHDSLLCVWLHLVSAQFREEHVVDPVKCTCALNLVGTL